MTQDLSGTKYQDISAATGLERLNTNQPGLTMY
jgi:hypothetical protein